MDTQHPILLQLTTNQVSEFIKIQNLIHSFALITFGERKSNVILMKMNDEIYEFINACNNINETINTEHDISVRMCVYDNILDEMTDVILCLIDAMITDEIVFNDIIEYSNLSNMNNNSVNDLITIIDDMILNYITGYTLFKLRQYQQLFNSCLTIVSRMNLCTVDELIQSCNKKIEICKNRNWVETEIRGIFQHV